MPYSQTLPLRRIFTFAVSIRFSLLLWALSTYTFAVGLVPLVTQVSRNYPLNPWEAATTVEAARWAAGQPVYESPDSGHATLIYGWLHTASIAAVQGLFAPSNQLARWVALIATCFLLWGLTRIAAAGMSLAEKIWVLSAFFAVNGLADCYFIAARPDMAAYALGFAGLCVSYGARSTGRWLFAALLFCLSLSFKQTGAVFAAIPLFAHLRGEAPTKWWWPWLPVFSVLGYLFFLRWLAPHVFFYMFGVFTQFPIAPRVFLFALWKILCQSPLLMVLAALALVQTRFTVTRLLWWSIVSLGLFALTSSMSYAKAGGSTNSLIPFYLACAFTCALVIRELGLFEAEAPRARLLGLLVCFLWVLQWYPTGPALNRGYLGEDLRQQGYTDTVRAIALLRGRVVCPEDPTLVLFAKSELGKNVYLERDIRPVWSEMPPSIARTIEQADYVVDVERWFGDEYIRPTILTRLGFKLHQQLPSYSIWKKS